MTEQEVKQRIGEENWEAFNQWMRGRTVGLNDDGSLDFYEQDVRRFGQEEENRK